MTNSLPVVVQGNGGLIVGLVFDLRSVHTRDNHHLSDSFLPVDRPG